MLTNLLPGVRELRAPLAGGFLWLLLAWLLWGDAVPDRSDATGTVARLFEVEDLVLGFGVAVALSVGAYMIGSIVLDLQAAAGRLLGFDSSGSNSGVAFLFTRSGTDAVKYAMSPSAHFLDYIEALGWIRQNRRVLKTRLLDVSPCLHDEVDRPDAEATLRLALWPPLLGVILVLAVEVSDYWLVALGLPVLLAMQWIMRRRESNDALAIATISRSELREMMPH